MDREIIFRAKPALTNALGDGESLFTLEDKWYEGYLMSPNRLCLYDDNLGVLPYFEINPNTVGEYSGRTDKNNVKMFEGDIVKGLFYHEKPMLAVVKFKNGSFGLEWNRSGAKTFNPFTGMCNIEYEVLGNIFDNADLLK